MVRSSLIVPLMVKLPWTKIEGIYAHEVFWLNYTLVFSFLLATCGSPTKTPYLWKYGCHQSMFCSVDSFDSSHQLYRPRRPEVSSLSQKQCSHSSRCCRPQGNTQPPGNGCQCHNMWSLFLKLEQVTSDPQWTLKQVLGPWDMPSNNIYPNFYWPRQTERASYRKIPTSDAISPCLIVHRDLEGGPSFGVHWKICWIWEGKQKFHVALQCYAIPIFQLEIRK